MFQNPYYESNGVLRTDDEDAQELPSDIEEAENVKVVENPYYGQV